MKTSHPLKLLKLLLIPLQKTETMSLGITLDGYNFLLRSKGRTAGWLLHSLSVVKDSGHSTTSEYYVMEEMNIVSCIDKEWSVVYTEAAEQIEKCILQYIEKQNVGIQTHIPVKSLIQAQLYIRGE